MQDLGLLHKVPMEIHGTLETDNTQDIIFNVSEEKLPEIIKRTQDALDALTRQGRYAYRKPRGEEIIKIDF